jgi:hypothetical protein
MYIAIRCSVNAVAVCISVSVLAKIVSAGNESRRRVSELPEGGEVSSESLR